MTLLTAAAVTAVVWAVSLVGPVRLRAFIYSLPVPITVALLGTGYPVDARHLVGVALLYVFVAVVAWLHLTHRWHILLADGAGAAVYVTGGWLLVQVGELPFPPVLGATVVAWAVVVAVETTHARRRAATGPVERAGGESVPSGRSTESPYRLRPAVGKLTIIAAGALLMTGLGGLLRGMVVTFPYAGVLVVVETRHELRDFRAHFATNSLALLAFVAAGHATRDHPAPVAVAAGWGAFLGCALLLWAVQRVRARRTARL